MQNLSVKDLMVPIEEYATVRYGTTLLGAIQELEKVQESYTDSKYQHRSILVLDETERVVGKIGQLRILKAVETRHDLKEELDHLEKFRFSDKFISNRREQYRQQGPILNRESLKEAMNKRVEEFMQKPTPGEFVSESSSIDLAIHRLVSGTHLSLLVTKNDRIVGILRIADVFAAVFHEVKAKGLDECQESHDQEKKQKQPIPEELQ